MTKTRRRRDTTGPVPALPDFRDPIWKILGHDLVNQMVNYVNDLPEDAKP